MNMDYLSYGLDLVYKRQLKTQQNQKFADTINVVLAKYGITDKVTYEDFIHLEMETINTLICSFDKRLVTIIEDFIWEKVGSNQYVYHFTKDEIGRQIEASKKFRLYNISKRFCDDEIQTFFREFKIPYFFDEHYENIFYCSFTQTVPKLSDGKKIKTFRQFTMEWGAKLKFRVNSNNSNFRKVVYDINKLQILKDLINAIKVNYNIELNVNGWTTKFAAFHINENFSDEDEVRYYIKTDTNDLHIYDEKLNSSYLEIDISSNMNNLFVLEEVVYEKDKEIFDE